MYTIILNSEIKNHKYKSLIHLSVSQCQTAWKKWSNDKCIDCLYEKSGDSKDAGYICHPYSELYIPLFVVDYSIYFILMILLLIGVFKRSKMHVFLEAWNQYQQWFIILCFIIWSSKSSNVIKTLSFTLTPYWIPLIFLRFFYFEYSYNNKKKLS